MTVADNTSSFHLPVADSAATRRRVLEIVKGTGANWLRLLSCMFVL